MQMLKRLRLLGQAYCKRPVAFSLFSEQRNSKKIGLIVNLTMPVRSYCLTAIPQF